MPPLLSHSSLQDEEAGKQFPFPGDIDILIVINQLLLLLIGVHYIIVNW